MTQRFVAYYRVSTARQSLGLEAQRAAVLAYVAGKGELLEEYREKESGKRHENRPELTKALAHCRKAKLTLVIAKLDRLARNVAFVSKLMESKVEFVACDFPMANKLTIHILAAVAEHEREMIAQRTKDALQAKLAQGAQLGKFLRGTAINKETGETRDPSRARAMAAETLRNAADKRAANVLPIIEKIRMQGTTTLSGIAAELNERGIKTARRNGQWHARSVARIVERGAS
jgi:DNA invertase Pin-like site-specific DNA recombinase